MKSIVALLTFVLLNLVVVNGQGTNQQDPVERIRIDSDLVDLNVSVFGRNLAHPGQPLSKDDFRVFEDGVPQEISFFEAADTAFDLVLMLDLSASTSRKLKMIKRSAKRFVDATRPTDRVAIVTFTDRPYLLSNFSFDRNQTKKRIDEIKDAIGGTNFWDATSYVLRDVIGKEHSRRSAIVVMSDGVDNALPDVPGPGSRITFDRLIFDLRLSDAIVFPIYLDTEEADVKRYHMPRTAYASARLQLEQIAAESGTVLYRAAKLKDLDELYNRILSDLSTVYSIGYRPTKPPVEGAWRTVAVQLVDQPELLARTRKGYYSKGTVVQ